MKPSNKNNCANGGRDLRLDSIKGFLILMVVLGHTIEPYFSHEPFCAVYTIIYTFHMPLFVLISGLVFATDTTAKKLMIGVLHLAETLIVFQLIRTVVLLIKGVSPTLHNLIWPQWTLWYLLSLIIWRVMSFIFFKYVGQNYRKQVALFCVSFIFALLAGYVPLDGQLSFQRTFAFFPFFVLGILLRKHETCFAKWKWQIIMGGGIMLIIMLLAYLWYPYDWKHALYNNVSYTMGYTVFIRCVCLVASLGISLLLFVVFPTNKLLAKVGTATLTVYLFHTFAVELITAKLINPGTIPVGLFWCVLYAGTVTICCYWFSKTKLSKFIINPLSSLFNK